MHTHFLRQNLAAVVSASNSTYSGPPLISQGPQNASAIVGQTATFSVTAAGPALTYQWQSMIPGGAAFVNIPGATSSSYTTPPTALTDNGTQFLCIVTNGQGSVSSNTATLTVFATSSNTLRRPATDASKQLYRLGRNEHHRRQFAAHGHFLGAHVCSGKHRSHTVKIVNAATGSDVSGASVSVPMSGGAPGDFVYANLSGGVALSANTSYYILTQETSGGDEWYDWNTTAQTTSAAALAAPEYGLPYTAVGSSNGHLYGPVDFQYALLCRNR